MRSRTSAARNRARVRCAVAAALATATAGVTLLAGSRDAKADDCEPDRGFSTCIDVDNLWARPGSSSFFHIGSTLTTPEGNVAFGNVVSYQRRPYRLEAPGAALEPRDFYVVDNALDVSFLLALGVTDRLELTVAAPVTLYQDGTGYFELQGSDEVLPRSVVRDPRLGFAVTFLRPPRVADAQGFSLTGRFEIAAPLGDGESFAGARGATFVPAVTAAYRIGPVEIAAELGARVRGDEEIGEDTWGTQVSAGLGVNVIVYEPALLSVSAEGIAMPVVAAQSQGTPMLVPAEWLASVRAAPFFAGDVFFQLGAGSSIPFTGFAATSPEVRVAFAGGYAPRALDSDQDSVLDRDDKCPGSKEDRDGFKDDDGCVDPDNDEDRILDADDRCRDAAETVDNFQDDDGCPDLDDDRDKIPDEEDQCRNDPEDKDGTQDADGCPELDDDRDDIPDDKDQCPSGPEDKDGYNDTDGCPDPDNDGDGVADTADKCQGPQEDKDKFADEDGCPDPDNDGDGVLDEKDRCPTDAETLDGKDDEDGCPEAGAKSLVKLVGGRTFVVEGIARFKPGSAEPTPELERQIRLVAALAKGQGASMILIVEAYPDKPNDKAGEALAIKRAQATRKILVAAGYPDDRITAASGDLESKRAADAPQLEFTIVRSSE